MCDLGTIGLVLSVASTAMASKGARDQGKYQQQIANNNAVAAEYQAEGAIEKGNLEAKQARLRAGQEKGSARTALAANGLDVDFGTAVDLQGDILAAGEQDAQQLKHNAALDAWGFRNQASNSRANGTLARTSGNNQAASSLLTGASSVASKWGDYKKAKGTTAKGSGGSISTYGFGSAAPTSISGSF